MLRIAIPQLGQEHLLRPPASPHPASHVSAGVIAGPVVRRSIYRGRNRLVPVLATTKKGSPQEQPATITTLVQAGVAWRIIDNRNTHHHM